MGGNTAPLALRCVMYQCESLRGWSSSTRAMGLSFRAVYDLAQHWQGSGHAAAGRKAHFTWPSSPYEPLA